MICVPGRRLATCISQAGEPTSALWVFVSTVGELNAIDPLLKALVAHNEHLQLVLLTDRPHYRDIYLSRYPQAFVAIINGHSNEAARLAERYPPELASRRRDSLLARRCTLSVAIRLHLRSQAPWCPQRSS